MKHKIFMCLVIGAGLILFGCSDDSSLLPGADPVAMDLGDQGTSTLKSAKKPLPQLLGIQECTILPVPPFSECTIDFGDYGVYGVVYIPYAPPRDFSQANVFEEDFIIYELGTEWTNPENVVMKGLLRGAHALANKPPEPTHFVTNGTVAEAYGPFEMWAGCNIHGSGEMHWSAPGIPEAVYAIMQIN